MNGTVRNNLRITKLTVMFTSLVMLLAFTIAPASAHDVREPGPQCTNNGLVKSCGFGQARDNHQIIDACDTFADGRGLHVEYALRNGSLGNVPDGNGSKSGCGIARVGASSPIVAIRVCSVKENVRNCTRWETV